MHHVDSWGSLSALIKAFQVSIELNFLSIVQLNSLYWVLKPQNTQREVVREWDKKIKLKEADGDTQFFNFLIIYLYLINFFFFSKIIKKKSFFLFIFWVVPLFFMWKVSSLIFQFYTFFSCLQQICEFSWIAL